MLKLFRLSQSENNNYDTYDSCIVCAENEEDAKTIYPNGGEFKPYSGGWGGWALTKEGIKCEEIGIANENQERGVILASFNAG